MTTESTTGNFCGLRMEPVIGMTYQTCRDSGHRENKFSHQTYSEYRCAINDIL